VLEVPLDEQRAERLAVDLGAQREQPLLLRQLQVAHEQLGKVLRRQPRQPHALRSQRALGELHRAPRIA